MCKRENRRRGARRRRWRRLLLADGGGRASCAHSTGPAAARLARTGLRPRAPDTCAPSAPHITSARYTGKSSPISCTRTPSGAPTLRRARAGPPTRPTNVKLRKARERLIRRQQTPRITHCRLKTGSGRWRSAHRSARRRRRRLSSA